MQCTVLSIYTNLCKAGKYSVCQAYYPLFQDKEIRHKEVKRLAQGHTVVSN